MLVGVGRNSSDANKGMVMKDANWIDPKTLLKRVTEQLMKQDARVAELEAEVARLKAGNRRKEDDG